MNKNHNRLQSVHNDDYESVKDTTLEIKKKVAKIMIMRLIQKKVTTILNQTSLNHTFAQNESVMTWKPFQITSSKLILYSNNSM